MSSVSRPFGTNYRTSAAVRTVADSLGDAGMKIRRISAYQVDLPLREGRYNWSGGKSVSVFDSTIVRVGTDEGLVGHGEVCPLGPFYLPAYGAGPRRNRRIGPPFARTRPDATRAAQSPDGCGIAGPSLREIGDRHGLLGSARAGGGTARLRVAWRTLQRRLSTVSCHFARFSGAHGRERDGVSTGGVSQVSIESRRRSADRH